MTANKAAPIAAVSLLGALVLCLAFDFLVSSFFLVTVARSIPYSPGMTFKLWQSYGMDPVYSARLAKISLGLLFVATVGVAMAFVFFRRGSSLHGDARFASYSEIQKEGLLGDSGILFGKIGSRYLLLPGQRHILAVAPTRGGKTTAIAIPNLLNWPGSIVALDVKLELFIKTSGFRAAHGHEAFLFNPFAEDFRTNCWNPLDGVRRGNDGRLSVFTVQDLMGIATVLYPSKEGDATSQFFSTQAQNLFLGIALLALESRMPLNFAQILRVRASSHEGGFEGFARDVVRRRTELSEPCRGALQQFLGATGDTLSSVLATFDAPLLVFRNSLVAAATSRSDFKLSELRRRRMSLYLGVTPRDIEQGSVLLTLFITQALYQNLDTLPENDPSIRHQALFILDEFRVLGKMSVLVDAAGYLAGYGIRLLTILQSIGQLGIYGDKTARAFMTNHGAKVVFAPREESDAKEISEALGTFTEMSDSYSRNSSGRFLDRSAGLSTGTSSSAQRRALMLPQEVKLLPFKEELAFVEGMHPIKARKALYFEDALLKARLYPPITIAMLDVDEHANAVEQAPAATALTANGAPAPAAAQPPASPREASAPERVDPSSLDEQLGDLRMESVDPENPTDEEVQAYVNKFTQRLEELGAWES